MSETPATGEAWACARAAADRAGVTLGDLATLEDADKVNEVIERVWGAQRLHRELIRAMQHAGSALTGVFDGDRMVGFSLGFVGLSGGLHLHSHMAAVLPGMEHRGIGYALKLGQRAAGLGMGVEEIRWTYDPLVARNARFNLVKLGAVGTAFWPQFYGEMDDLINQGDRSDRFEVVWELLSSRVERLAAHGPPSEVPTPVRGAVLLEAKFAAAGAGLPEPRPTGAPVEEVSLVGVPRDHAGIKARDPGLAAAWRSASSEAFALCFQAGLVAGSFTSAGEYVFVRPTETRDEH